MKNSNNISTYLTNLGIINALGSGQAEVCANLLHNSQHGMQAYDKLLTGNKGYIGEVSSPLVAIPKHLKQYNCRNNQLLATTYEQIKSDVEQLKQQYGKQRIGVVLGTSTSGIASGEHAMAHYQQHHMFDSSFNYIQQEIGSCSEFLSHYADVAGVHYTVSTACSSSGKAIAAGDRLIKAGFCDAVIVGGSDSLCELTLNGFDSLELMSDRICNPISVNRSGLNIGEGAALFVLSKHPSPIKLRGVGEASDGYHISTPDPSGMGAKLAITQALKSANISANDVAYINLHGTGTLKNDEMECHVVNALFPNTPPCSSTKPLTGHTLGAAAAIELGLCWLLLSPHNPDRRLATHLWDQQTDPALATLNLSTATTHWDSPIFMSNSFAFGGSNVSLIIERCES